MEKEKYIIPESIKNISWDDFDEGQRREMLLGVEEGLDASIYANPKFSAFTMEDIRFALKNNIDVSAIIEKFNDFDEYQFTQIIRGMYHRVDVSIYAKPEFDWKQMKQIMRGLEKGLDPSIYAKREYDYAKMTIIQYAMEDKVIDKLLPYIDENKFDDRELNEIRIRIEG